MSRPSNKMKKSRSVALADAAILYGGIEVHKDDWKDAEEAVKNSTDVKLELSSARGPGAEWKRLRAVDDE